MGQNEQGVARTRHRYQYIPRTLVFVTHNDRLLLLKGGPHKRLWAGRYNALGGHVERGEDALAAALREVREEAGIELAALRLAGLVHIDAGDPDSGILLFVFQGEATTLDAVESPEGALEWRTLGDLPVGEMVEDLPVLIPRVLTPAPPFFATYHYDGNDRLVIRFGE